MFFEQVAGLVLEEFAGSDGWELDVNAVGALFQGVDRHLLLVIARRPLARDHTVFPAVPRAGHEFSLDAALGQRSTFVIADVGDRRQPPCMQEYGDAMALDLDGEGSASDELVLGAQTVPHGHTLLGVESRSMLYCSPHGRI